MWLVFEVAAGSDMRFREWIDGKKSQGELSSVRLTIVQETVCPWRRVMAAVKNEKERG